jgi:Asp-tRNA(Asn)/Glu-tRNA(Gln) amidotransferase A subunit family amidase
VAELGADVLFASVRELGTLLRMREISSVELTRAYLDRLETIGPRLGAVATVTRELALAQAKNADEELAIPRRYRGPLHGVPYGAKDLLATKGIPTSLQLLGRAFSEATLPAIADRYQQATDWHKRRPPEPRA